ncbi:hypothetical protein B1812_06035 [Methylocystis bryophila]|uniref:Uncharacterized protein n=1 Tax=Methylocystis bryophila TaxID=655015 RepID=A0A1W6MSY6_9HYPH|nr:hypothetical protein B1812_06035 [Methylocystis bryophila]
MLRRDALEERFEKRLRSRPVAYAPEICEEGLVLGAGTILARMKRDASGAPCLAVEEDEDRLLALLAAAQGRPASPALRRHLEGASGYWRRGEKALANIRLAFCRHPPVGRSQGRLSAVSCRRTARRRHVAERFDEGARLRAAASGFRQI